MSDAYEQAAIEDEVEVKANPIAALASRLVGYPDLVQAVVRVQTSSTSLQPRISCLRDRAPPHLCRPSVSDALGSRSPASGYCCR